MLSISKLSTPTLRALEFYALTCLIWVFTNAGCSNNDGEFIAANAAAGVYNRSTLLWIRFTESCEDV